MHLCSILNTPPIQSLSHPLFCNKSLNIKIKRDDLIHPIISGNKWLKLKHCLLDIEAKQMSCVASMGGRYSNLLHTLSYVGMLLGWQVELFILGYKQQPETPMMKDAKRWGATIHLVDRKTFQQLRYQPPYLNAKTYWLPEGGYSQLALKGVAESLMDINEHYDYLISASATATTLAGYLLGKQKRQLKTKMLGVAVLKNDDEIEKHLQSLINFQPKDVSVIRGYECGGYAKSNDKLKSQILFAKQNFALDLEPIYSGKAFMALNDLVAKDYFPPNSNILFVHCGGMQGMRAS